MIYMCTKGLTKSHIFMSCTTFFFLELRLKENRISTVDITNTLFISATLYSLSHVMYKFSIMPMFEFLYYHVLGIIFLFFFQASLVSSCFISSI